MDERLKADIAEIIALVKTFPDHLQLRGMEMLLQECLDHHRGGDRTKKSHETRREAVIGAAAEEWKGIKSPENSTPSITLPMRLKAFMKKHSIKMEHLDQLFHFENEMVVPTWSLDADKVSPAQIELALMEALKRSIEAGEFSFDPDTVRDQCVEKKTYDKANFKANFKNNSKLFAVLKEAGPISLSDEGMSKLADMIRSKSGID